MRLLKAGLVLLGGALILISASSALALELPDLHVLSGEIYPATTVGEVAETEVGRLETELGEKITASTVKIEAELLELGSLGPALITLTGFIEPKSKTSCNTAGDAAGTILIPGEYHVVDTSTSPLTAALLILFKEAVFECNSGKLKLKLRGPWIVKLEKVTSGTDVTQYGLVSKCSGKGKQELKTYLNDE
ncbi:MAG TPA: hypothetical protein VMB05_01715, partial [Solirubrobacteraceae bacterium]|nr:hypothetical protein [Solirubrobacteraceae bacterium]